jgi:rhodanese-related sulfurtransferase
VGSFAELLKWAHQHDDRRQRLRPITPEELKRALDAGEAMTIVDLRHPLDFLPDPRVIPGTIRISPEEIATRHQEIPRDRDVVLYCTCPSESTSRDVAALLTARGITRVRPLIGGFQGWRLRGYPLVELQQTAVSGT